MRRTRSKSATSTDLIAKEIANFAADLFDKGVRSPLGPEASGIDLAASLASIITTGLTMGRITTDFPQYHIMGVIHATIRWMRRRYQVNDPMDHQHATTALPYCNAFFTERDLRDTLTRGPFHLDRAYGCHVISDPNEAVAYLEKIAGKNPERRRLFREDSIFWINRIGPYFRSRRTS